MYKREKENSKVIWSKQVITPPPITIDLGYGEKETIEYNYSYVTLDTDEYIYIYSSANGKRAHSTNIGLYSITGEFIKNVDIQFSGYPAFIEMKNKNIMIFTPLLSSNFSNLTIIDKEINYKGNPQGSILW